MYVDLENFSYEEFDCKETGENEMETRFLVKLQALRYDYGKPLTITSGYRSEKHSIEVAKSAPGSHSSGLTADIAVGPGEDVHRLLELAFRHGFTGIGISQREGQPRFVHLDLLPRKAVWGY